MRLINCKTLELEEYFGANIPDYAILSHTWGREEVSFSDLPLYQPSTAKKAGYLKIKHTCEQALHDGLQYAWVDTCCIDKTSSAELSEAINSMFNWYSRSCICYAFLVDVSAIGLEGELPGSRWFTRGWTLQELIAPAEVIFYDRNWTEFGRRSNLSELIGQITRIDSTVLSEIKRDRLGQLGSRLDSFCIAKKMSWASYRKTTRKEDEAYCLMGMFGINMPLLYGEGEKAFVRLQEEIIRKLNNDDSILAWGLDTEGAISSADGTAPQHNPPRITGLVLAKSPFEFKNCVALELAPVPGPLLTLDNLGITIRLPLVSMHVATGARIAERLLIGLLSCSLRTNKSSHMVGILLSPKEWTMYPTFPRHVVRRSIPLHSTYSRTVLVSSRDALASTDFQQITIVPYIQQNPAGPSLYNRSYLIDEKTRISAVGLCLVHVEGWYGDDYPQLGGREPKKRDGTNWQADSRTYTRLWNDPPIHVISLAYSCRHTHPDVAFIVHLEMSLNLATVYVPSGISAEYDMQTAWDLLQERRWQMSSDRMMYTYADGRRIEMSVSLKEKRTIHQWRIFSVEVDVVDVSSSGSRVVL